MRILNPTISGSLVITGSIDSNLIPSINETYDLGSPTKKWRDLYLSGSTIYLGDTMLSSGDSGSLMVMDSQKNMLPIMAKSIEVGEGNERIRIQRDANRGVVKFVQSTMDIDGTSIVSTDIIPGIYSGSFTGSFIGDGSQLSGVTSYTDSDTLSYINSLNVVSGSVNWGTLIGKPSGIVSSSSQLSDATIPGNLTVGGILTAQEFHTEFVSASIIYQSGSTQFGNSNDDTHTFIGTLSANTIQNVISSSAQVDYNSIQNQPTIPTNNNQLTNGAGYITSAGNAATATNADTLDGYHGSNYIGLNGNSYYQLTTWLQSTGTHGFYSPNSGAGTHFYPGSLGDYGSFRVDGRKGGWSGYSIEGRTLFMHNGNTAAGLYNDVNNQWMFYAIFNSSTYMGYAGTYNRFYTTSGGATLEGTFSATGDVIAYSSDKRLKKNIKSLGDASQIISNINVYNFDWDIEKVEQVGFTPTQYNEDGFIAQELKEVYPNAVDYAPFDRNEQGESKSGEDYLTVKPDKLIPLLIQSNKELQKRIEKLEQKLLDNGITN